MKIIEKGAYLKNKIDKMTAELRIINRQLAEQHPPEPGSKTSKAVYGPTEATITTRENVKWCQTGLETARKLHPGSFGRCFKIEYKPIAKSINTANPEFVDFITQFKTVSPGQPQVKYETIDIQF